MKTHRLFALLDQLRAARHPVSAETLAGRLEVSICTIHSDIASLQEMGAPIREEPSLGYELEKGYFLPPLGFDPDETAVIVLGLRLIKAREGQDMKEAADRVLAKIAAIMGADAGHRFRALPLMAATRRRPKDDLAARWGSVLRKAIRDRRILTIGYHDHNGHDSHRNIHPLGLTLFDDVWLLTAWCESRKDFRNFRLDRVDAIEMSNDVFPVISGRRFRDYLLTLRPKTKL